VTPSAEEVIAARERFELILSADKPPIRSYDPGRDDQPDALLQIELSQQCSDAELMDEWA